MAALESLSGPHARPTLRPQSDRSAGILIADDDEMIRAMLGVFCRHQGLRCWLARNGQEAMQLYRQHHGEIALVMLDVQMPEMDGPHALAKLQEIDPQVACLFMSGDWEPYTPDELIETGAVGLMVKPFRLNALARVVRDCLCLA